MSKKIVIRITDTSTLRLSNPNTSRPYFRMKKKVRESATGEQLRRDAGVRHLIFGGFFLLVFHLPQAG
jgi:hypothetical protein